MKPPHENFLRTPLMATKVKFYSVHLRLHASTHTSTRSSKLWVDKSFKRTGKNVL